MSIKEGGERTRFNQLPKTFGPFRIVATTSHLVTIDEDSIPKAVSFDCVSPASIRNSAQRNDGKPSEATKRKKETHERDGDEQRTQPTGAKANNRVEETEFSNKKDWKEKLKNI